MPVPAELRVFRVTVRGRFRDLTDEARRFLVAAMADHDIFLSSYTEEGTLTYDARIDFFNFRYEVRLAGEEAESHTVAHAVSEAERFLRTMRIGFVVSRTSAVEMSAVWRG